MYPLLQKKSLMMNPLKYDLTQLKVATCSMQGWRKGMEDAHICVLNIIPGVSLFGVFDGHGGEEVSAFVRNHFPVEMKKWLLSKKDMTYEQGLTEVFQTMDELLQTTEGKAELNDIYTKCNKVQSSFLTKHSEDAANNVGCTGCVCIS